MLEGGEKVCVRHFGMIDMNHYGEHGRGWQKAGYHFIFCTFAQAGPHLEGLEHAEETREKSLQGKFKAEACLRT